MNRGAKIAIRLSLAAVLVIGGVLVYFVFFFELVPVSQTRIAITEVSDATHHLEAYYVDAGATSEGAVQVRRVRSADDYEIVGTTEVHWPPDSLALSQQESYVEAVLWYRAGASDEYTDTLRFSQK